MLLRNNSREVESLVRYFKTLDIKDKLKLSIVVLESDMKIDKEKLIEILKNILCFFDKSYNKNVMISYQNNLDVFVLSKIMEMNEKERNNFVFEILYVIREYLIKYCNFM